LNEESTVRPVTLLLLSARASYASMLACSYHRCWYAGNPGTWTADRRAAL